MSSHYRCHVPRSVVKSVIYRFYLIAVNNGVLVNRGTLWYVLACMCEFFVFAQEWSWCVLPTVKCQDMALKGL